MCSVWKWVAVKMFFMGETPQPPLFIYFFSELPNKPTISTYAFYAHWFVNVKS